MNILITGTSNGIGKATALKFLKEGHSVIGFDKEESSIVSDNYKHYSLDVGVPRHLPDLPISIDIIINNAGTQTADPKGGIDDIYNNLLGSYYVTEGYAFHEGIKSVLMIGSASGHTGAEFPLYSASKGGVLTYTKNVALRLAKYGATCNSLDFGGVLTDLNKPVTEDKELWDKIMALTPLKKWMTVEEAADWIYFMTVTNSFCSGQNILIDGLEAGNANFIWPNN